MSRSRWGEATDEPAREDARPTNDLKVLRVADPRSGFAPTGPRWGRSENSAPELLSGCVSSDQSIVKRPIDIPVHMIAFVRQPLDHGRKISSDGGEMDGCIANTATFKFCLCRCPLRPSCQGVLKCFGKNCCTIRFTCFPITGDGESTRHVCSRIEFEHLIECLGCLGIMHG